MLPPVFATSLRHTESACYVEDNPILHVFSVFWLRHFSRKTRRIIHLSKTRAKHAQKVRNSAFSVHLESTTYREQNFGFVQNGGISVHGSAHRNLDPFRAPEAHFSRLEMCIWRATVPCPLFTVLVCFNERDGKGT
jgi:hypothetical protein